MRGNLRCVSVFCRHMVFVDPDLAYTTAHTFPPFYFPDSLPRSLSLHALLANSLLYLLASLSNLFRASLHLCICPVGFALTLRGNICCALFGLVAKAISYLWRLCRLPRSDLRRPGVVTAGALRLWPRRAFVGHFNYDGNHLGQLPSLIELRKEGRPQFQMCFWLKVRDARVSAGNYNGSKCISIVGLIAEWTNHLE